MTVAIANVDMAAAWDGDEGDDWARDWQRYDRSIQRYQDRLLVASTIDASDQVLDIGCGNGESTRAAARVAVDGSALGVDLSTRMVERARELASSEVSLTSRSSGRTLKFTRSNRTLTTWPSAGSERCSSPIGSRLSATSVTPSGPMGAL